MDRSEKGNEKNQEDVTLVEALETTGFGKYSYLVILTAGVNVCGSIFATLLLAYVIPATDCDLNLSIGQKGVLSTMMFTGMIFTSHLMGYLADEYGRKYVCMRCNLMSSLLTLVTAFCPDFISLVVVTFLNGAATSGVIIPSYVFLGETIPTNYRPISMLFCGAIGNVGSAILPCLAIFLVPLGFHWDIFGYFTFSSWRLLIVAASLPPLLGAALFLTLYESPKYLLTKGYDQETLEVLKHIFSVNTGKSVKEFSLSTPPRLDENEIRSTSDGGFRRIWRQTALLFHKPLMSKTLMACVLQAGIVGVCNVYFLWLPQIVTQLLNFSADHPDFGVTMCYVVQSQTSHTSGNITGPDVQIIDECVVNVPVDTYYVSTLMGISQFFVFVVSGSLTKITGNKMLLVVYTLACAALSFILTLSTNMYVVIVCMAGSGILLATCIPIAIGMLMDLFPTSIRSTASCICMFCGRIASSLLTQMMGLLQKDYCDVSYWAIGIFLGCIGLLALFFLKDTRKTSS